MSSVEFVETVVVTAPPMASFTYQIPTYSLPAFLNVIAGTYVFPTLSVGVLRAPAAVPAPANTTMALCAVTLDENFFDTVVPALAFVVLAFWTKAMLALPPGQVPLWHKWSPT